MARRRALDTAVIAALLAALLGASARVEAVRERLYPPTAIDDESLYVKSGTVARRLTFASNALAADLYWIRAIQYYGGTKRMLGTEQQVATGTAPVGANSARHQYALLYPMLDLTTSLDPRFNIAYRFGAIFLAEAPPAGPGRPDLAIALLEKGLRERADKWEYMQDIGFVHYWWRHDFLTAAEWFGRAAEVPGAPWWLRSLRATTLVQGGDRETSRRMWETIRDSAEIDWLRREAERRLAQLRALDQIDVLQGAIDRYDQNAPSAGPDGSKPSDWMTLVRAHALPGIPVDPTGVAYELVGGHVRLSTSSSLYPLPDARSVTVHPAS